MAAQDVAEELIPATGSVKPAIGGSVFWLELLSRREMPPNRPSGPPTPFLSQNRTKSVTFPRKSSSVFISKAFVFINTGVVFAISTTVFMSTGFVFASRASVFGNRAVVLINTESAFASSVFVLISRRFVSRNRTSLFASRTAVLINTTFERRNETANPGPSRSNQGPVTVTTTTSTARAEFPGHGKGAIPQFSVSSPKSSRPRPCSIPPIRTTQLPRACLPVIG